MGIHRNTFLSLVFAVLLAATAGSGEAAAKELQPMDPQPAAENLAPGLSVHYYAAYFRLIDEFIEWIEEEGGGEKGEPLPMLNYRVADGTALTSAIADGVGAEIEGLIHFEKTGIYTLVMQSNDGFVLKIGGVYVLEDPDVHADRYSPFAKLEVKEPGWYPLALLYFERKGTATLELYWRPPGDEDADLAFVPAEAFAHLPAN